MSRKIAEILLKTKAVTLSPEKPFTWASGIRSPIYTDNRVILSYPDERRLLVRAFVNAVKRECPEFDVIAAIATSGIPWAAWVAEEMGKPLVYVREKKKDHGRENRIEGRLEKGETAIVIEDLISTGGSSVSAVHAVRDAGGLVTHCFAIFTYGLRESSHAFGSAGCRLVTLTDLHELMELAKETGYISEPGSAGIAEWLKDPQGWER